MRIYENVSKEFFGRAYAALCAEIKFHKATAMQTLEACVKFFFYV